MTATTHPNESAPKHDPADRLTAEQAAYVDGLRELAGFLAEYPGFICPAIVLRQIAYTRTREGMVASARKIGGKWDKEADGDSAYFHLSRSFGPHEVSLYTERENVCERVVTTETVTHEVPDPDAPPVRLVTVTEEVETAIWVCPDSLLNPDAGLVM